MPDQLPAAVELRLPTAPLPDDVAWSTGAGRRALRVRLRRRGRAPVAHQRLAGASDAVGDDIELLWAEESWVLATAPLDATTDRLQDLLADLAEVAAALEQGQNAPPTRLA